MKKLVAFVVILGLVGVAQAGYIADFESGFSDGVTLDGTSLLPLFATGKLTRPKPLYWFYNPSRPVCVIRDGDWCLLADPERIEQMGRAARERIQKVFPWQDTARDLVGVFEETRRAAHRRPRAA